MVLLVAIDVWTKRNRHLHLAHSWEFWNSGGVQVGDVGSLALEALADTLPISLVTPHVGELLHPIAASRWRSIRRVSQVWQAWSYVRSHRGACRQCSHCGVSDDCSDGEEQDRTSRHAANLLICFNLLECGSEVWRIGKEDEVYIDNGLKGSGCMVEMPACHIVYFLILENELCLPCNSRSCSLVSQIWDFSSLFMWSCSTLVWLARNGNMYSLFQRVGSSHGCRFCVDTMILGKAKITEQEKWPVGMFKKKRIVGMMFTGTGQWSLIALTNLSLTRAMHVRLKNLITIKIKIILITIKNY